MNNEFKVLPGNENQAFEVCVELAYETLALVLSSAVVCRLAGVNRKVGYSRMASVLRI